MDTMDKTKLLSIGTLSKLTGVHIKSLRYYDKIGILPPVYVDPDTKYRYYSFSQIHVVDAIQLCVDLDIPLKQFPEFVGSQNREIYFAKLLARGTELANAKIRSIQDRLNFLNQVQEELLRTGTCHICKKGAEHSITNTGDEDLVLITVVAER